jgi:DNA-binding transcriptional LysR family regulator
MSNLPPTEQKVALPRLSVRKIGCFVAAADAGSISAAARMLCLPQATLSEAIIDLEKDMGVDLLVRHKARGVTLTSAGHQLLAEARALVRHAEAFETSARGPGADLSGEIMIGCFPTLLPFIGPQLLAGFQASHPAVSVHFVEDAQPGLEQSLMGGTIDIAVLYDIDTFSALQRRVLYECRPYVLLSKNHRLANWEGPIDLKQLIDEPFIQMDVVPGKDDYVFSCAGIAPHPTHRTTNFELVRSLVARNLGYSILVQRPASNTTYEGLPLIILPIANPMPALRVIFAWPTQIHLHRRVEALIEYGQRLYRTPDSIAT